MKYQIGQQAWFAVFEMTTRTLTCPDCGGTGRLRVTFHDETQVSIDCRNCTCGYDPPSGCVTIHVREPHAELVTITGCEVTPDYERYHSGGGPYVYRLMDLANLYDTEAEALLAAKGKAARLDEEERQRVLHKEKDTRSWAWNASYHRRQIEQAKKDIAYHESKLAVASLKAKEDEQAVAVPSTPAAERPLIDYSKGSS